MEEVENCIIYIQTKESHVLKALSEFYHFAFTNLILHVTYSGITARTDNGKDGQPTKILADLHLNAADFLRFVVPEALEDDPEAEIQLCLEARLLRDASDCIRKKDKLTIFVTKDNPKKLKISVSDEEKGRNSISGIPLLNLSDMSDTDRNPSAPCQYTEVMPNATCVAGELQKACKGGGQGKNSKIMISAQKNGVEFEVNGSGIDRSFYFGSWKKGVDILYRKEFVAKGVVDTIARCCSMTETVKIYCERVKPVRFTLKCGSIGTLDIYLVHGK